MILATEAAKETIRRQTLALSYARTGRFYGDPDGEDFCSLIGFDGTSASRRLNDAQVDVTRAIREGTPRIIARIGRRGGKTVIAALHGAFETLRRDSTGWIIAPTHDLTSRCWECLHRILCRNGPIHPAMPWTKGLGLKADIDTNQPYRLRFPWGATVSGKTTQGDGKKSLDGESLTWFVWDECAYSDDVWEDHLMPNLADRRGWALFIGKPYGDNHFKRKWDLGNPKSAQRDPVWYSCHYTSEVNFEAQPGVKDSFIEARRNWTQETFEQEWLAEFTSFAGQVYKEFREDLHCADLQYDPDLPLYQAIDFGTTNPFVCLWIQVTGGDVIRIIDEWTTYDFKTQRSSGADIDQIGESLAVYQGTADPATGKVPYGEVSWAVCDRSEPSSISFLRRKYHMPTVAAGRLAGTGPVTKEVPAGIEVVRRFLGRGRLGEPNYQPPRLFVDRRRCPLTIYEFGRYRYPEIVAEVEAKENPVKADDHAMDCVRNFTVRRYGRTVDFADPDEPELTPQELLRRDYERRAVERKERAMVSQRWAV